MMKIVLLSIFVALAHAQSLGVAVVRPGQVVAADVSHVQQANGAQDIAIDITSAMADQYGDETLVQVNMTLVVAEGVASFQGHSVLTGVVTALSFDAMLYVKQRETGAILTSHPTSVTVQVSIEEQVSATGPSSLNVQELLLEVGRTHITEVGVQEAILTLDVNGNEVQRVVSEITIAESRLASAPEPDLSSPSSPKSPASPNSPDSPDSPNSPNSPKHHGHWWSHDCRLRKWYHRQSFAVRVLVAAAFTFVMVLAFYLMCRCCVACCSRPKNRSVYLNNVKLHYKPLATDEKKPVMMV
jgi:hypothetical protein